MTDAEAVSAALEALGSTPRPSRRGFINAACPLAHRTHAKGEDRNPSFGVLYAKRGKRRPGHATCLSCGFSGDLRSAAAKLFAWGDIDAAAFAAVNEAMDAIGSGGEPMTLAYEDAGADAEVPESYLSNFADVSTAAWAVAYLNARGVSRAVVDRFGLLADHKRQRIVFPLRDALGTLRGFQGRAVSPAVEPRYYFYTVPNVGVSRGYTWLGEQHVDPSRPVLVVEGPFDLLRASLAYPNTVSALSTGFRRPASIWWRNVTRWVTMFDAGQGGNVGRAHFDKAMLLPHAKVWHLEPPGGAKDPGAASPAEIAAALNNLVASNLSL